MTGQTFILLALVGLILGALPVLLLDDTRRAVARIADRRLGGWWVDVTTGKCGRSPFIPHGTAIMGAFPPRPLAPRIAWRTQDDHARDRLRIMAEERIALSVQRPTDFKITAGGVP